MPQRRTWPRMSTAMVNLMIFGGRVRVFLCLDRDACRCRELNELARSWPANLPPPEGVASRDYRQQEERILVKVDQHAWQALRLFTRGNSSPRWVIADARCGRPAGVRGRLSCS